MHPCVRPFLGALVPWPVWDSRVGLKTSDRARSSPCDTDFPNPDLSDRFHTRFSFSRIFEVVLPVPSACQKRFPSKLFVLRDHRPQHSGHLVRQGDGSQHPRFAGQETPQPGVFRRRSHPGPRDHRHCADDQQTPYIPLTGFARASKPWLAAAGMLSRNETQPGREVASLPETLHRRREGRQSHRGDGTNSRHLLQPSRKPRPLARYRDLCVEFRDAPGQIIGLLPVPWTRR